MMSSLPGLQLWMLTMASGTLEPELKASSFEFGTQPGSESTGSLLHEQKMGVQH